MFPADPESIALILLFIVPGFLLNQVKRRFAILEPMTGFEEVLAALAASTFLVASVEACWRAVTSNGFIFDGKTDLVVQGSTGSFWIRYVVVLGLGVLVGGAWARVRSMPWLRAAFSRVGFRIGHAPGPWDQLFDHDNQWLRVHLKDGRIVNGCKSGASAFPDSHELLLRDVDIYNADMDLVSSPGEIFIGADSIVMVEHFTGEATK